MGLKFHVLTLFPEMIYSGLNHSIIKRAIEKNLIYLNVVNIRDFSKNKHKKVDDYPYGGGTGLVIQAPPVYDAYKSLNINKNIRVCYLSPKGRIFNQNIAKEYSKEQEIVFICGHYEGIDQRVIDKIVTDELSIGDFILTGGELGAMIVIDSVTRLLPNVLSKENAIKNESFENNLLEHSQYTRPYDFLGMKVPDVLLNGNHKEIEKYRKNESIKITLEKRPDLREVKNECT
ncbi:MAG: tRNA (guanosine(37)-N1)-methyltransferase TrmD [Defluviitaleaceae bacterium]|nr:tRNA (guanosine(37)-N1)-methyltransferase TrmD [Defluviitaleaceae bacterium]